VVALLVESRQAIAHILQRDHLLGGEGPRLQRGQAQLADPLGGIAEGEGAGRLGADPGGERRQRGEVAVDRGGGETVRHELLAPGDDVALEHRRGAVVAVGALDELAEAVQVQGDLLRHLVRPHPVDGELEIELDPCHSV
jgi:hypothetical protein